MKGVENKLRTLHGLQKELRKNLEELDRRKSKGELTAEEHKARWDKLEARRKDLVHRIEKLVHDEAQLKAKLGQ
ncbi:MAG: hypothetical protein HY556_06895 [Euryarchaeota archaeon]|nr:hypothetical protein [Euryarchaeota archaeon]